MTACRGRCPIVLFTIDNYAGCHDWFDAPALQRCHHLSISGATSLERDAWLRAFFGEDLGNVWIETATEVSKRGDLPTILR